MVSGQAQDLNDFKHKGKMLMLDIPLIQLMFQVFKLFASASLKSQK